MGSKDMKVAPKAPFNSPTNTISKPEMLGRYHHLDNSSIFILNFVVQNTFGAFAILSGSSYKQLSSELRVTERNIRAKLLTLEKYGFLNIDKTTKPHKYFITEKGKMTIIKATFKSSVLPDQISKQDFSRPHEIWVNLFVRNPEMIKAENTDKWNAERDKIIRMSFNSPVEMGLNNNKIYEFSIDKVTVRSTPSKFILKIFSDKSAELFQDPEKATLRIFSVIERIAPKLENIFKVKLLWDNKIMAEISKESYALVFNEFAKQLLDCKAKLKDKEGKLIDINIYDENGNILYKPDRSLGVYCPEMDTDKLLYAERLTDFCKDVGTGKMSSAAIDSIDSKVDNILTCMDIQAKNIVSVTESLLNMSEKMEIYGNHLNSHLPALQGIKITTDKLNPAIEQMTILMKKLSGKANQKRIKDFMKTKKLTDFMK